MGSKKRRSTSTRTNRIEDTLENMILFRKLYKDAKEDLSALGEVFNVDLNEVNRVANKLGLSGKYRKPIFTPNPISLVALKQNIRVGNFSTIQLKMHENVSYGNGSYINKPGYFRPHQPLIGKEYVGSTGMIYDF